jgi:hypothetical protein
MGLGYSLHDAERIAGIVILWVVLLCLVTGSAVSFPGMEAEEPGDARASRTGTTGTAKAPAMFSKGTGSGPMVGCTLLQ